MKLLIIALVSLTAFAAPSSSAHIITKEDSDKYCEQVNRNVYKCYKKIKSYLVDFGECFTDITEKAYITSVEIGLQWREDANYKVIEEPSIKGELSRFRSVYYSEEYCEVQRDNARLYNLEELLEYYGLNKFDI